MSDWEQNIHHLSDVAPPRFWRKHVGSKQNKIWFVPDNNDPSEIYCYNKNDLSGFTKTILLEDGSSEKHEGIWNSNSTALFEDTAIDLSQYYRSRVVIGLDAQHISYGKSLIKDVIYRDEETQIGSWYRGELLARKLVRDNPRESYYVLTIGARGTRSLVCSWVNAFRSGYADDEEAIMFLKTYISQMLPTVVGEKLAERWDDLFPNNDIFHKIAANKGGRKKLDLLDTFALAMERETLCWPWLKGFIREELGELPGVGEMRVASLSLGALLKMDYDLANDQINGAVIYNNIRWDRVALRSMNEWFAENKRKNAVAVANTL